MGSVEWDALFPLSFGIAPDYSASLVLLRTGDTARAEAEAFVHERFDRMHHADVHHFMPELVGLYDGDGQLSAVAGMRLAAEEPLFLERYLDKPLEALVSPVAGRAVGRGELVEVGNLAAVSPGNARLIIVAMTWLLTMRGLHWVAFTGAPSLLNSFRRLGLEPTVLATADPTRLGGEAREWGSYYDQHPLVFTGSIRYGHDELERSGVLERLGFPMSRKEAVNAV